MSTFGFGFISASATTILGGSKTISIQVPGTFSSVFPTDPTAGRFLASATFWSDATNPSDSIDLLQVVDTDGVVPVPVRAAFPNYPVIFDMIDSIGGVQSSIMMPTSPLTITAFDSSGVASARFIPSQLYIKMTFTTGLLSLGQVFRVLVRWGMWQ